MLWQCFLHGFDDWLQIVDGSLQLFRFLCCVIIWALLFNTGANENGGQVKGDLGSPKGTYARDRR